jgi:hypothetical protein
MSNYLSTNEKVKRKSKTASYGIPENQTHMFFPRGKPKRDQREEIILNKEIVTAKNYK